MISNPMAGPAKSIMAYLTYYCQLWITPLTTNGAVWGLIYSVCWEEAPVNSGFLLCWYV